MVGTLHHSICLAMVIHDTLHYAKHFPVRFKRLTHMLICAQRTSVSLYGHAHGPLLYTCKLVNFPTRLTHMGFWSIYTPGNETLNNLCFFYNSLTQWYMHVYNTNHFLFVKSIRYSMHYAHFKVTFYVTYFVIILHRKSPKTITYPLV